MGGYNEMPITVCLTSTSLGRWELQIHDMKLGGHDACTIPNPRFLPYDREAVVCESGYRCGPA